MTGAGAAAYATLASMIERELELVSERRLAELEELQRLRVQLQSSLPATPPPAAAPLLERCLRLHKRLEIELARVREALLTELGQVRQAQRAAHGYAPVRRDGLRIATSA